MKFEKHIPHIYRVNSPTYGDKKKNKNKTRHISDDNMKTKNKEKIEA